MCEEGWEAEMDEHQETPNSSCRLYKREGGVTSGHEEVKTAWYQHFTKV